MPEPALVLVIDDMGQKLEPAEQLAQPARSPWPWPCGPMPLPAVRCSRWPGHGADVLCTMPMEAMPRKNGTAPNPGPGALETDMDAYAMEHALDKALAQVPTALGFNNHRVPGSPDGAMPAACWPVWPTGAACSCWTASPAATARLETSMVRQGIVTASRHVFSGRSPGHGQGAGRAGQGRRLARKQGIAIAIGHPHASTLRALERWENRESVAVVPLRRYVWHLAQLRAGQFGKPE